jgi:hypothetical protein
MPGENAPIRRSLGKENHARNVCPPNQQSAGEAPFPAAAVTTSTRRRGGSKPGERRGGRQTGTPNVATVEREERLDDAMLAATAAIGAEAISQMQPIDVLIFAMRLFASAGSWGKAADIASDAAPYIHHRLATVHTCSQDDFPIDPNTLSDADLVARIAAIDRALGRTVDVDTDQVCRQPGPPSVRKHIGATG